MLPIFIISLPQAKERRAHAARQMDELGLACEFFDACDGADGTAEFRRIDHEAFVLHTGREITPGEIGCYASHKRLWRVCVERDEPILIMEDDFRLEPAFGEAVHAASQLVRDLGFLRLQDERRGASKPLMTWRRFRVERYTKTPHCAMCYAVTPALARRWLELFEDFTAPVDVVLKHVWLFDNPMYCLRPYTVRSGDLSFDSMIGERAKCSKRLATRLRRTALKISWQWRRLLFNLAQSDREIRRRCADARLRQVTQEGRGGGGAVAGDRRA